MKTTFFYIANTRSVGIFVLSAIGLLLSGCSPLTTSPAGWFNDETETLPVLPDKILPIWTDTVLHQPGKKGVRGFGGRIYFYQDGKEKPVPVEGNITVYVFDGDYHVDHANQPLKKYIITSEQLTGLESTTRLGMSYNVWIPWEEIGGASKKLNLIARFDGTNGGTVISTSSTKLLPGIDSPANQFKAEKKYAGDAPTKSGVIPANYVEGGLSPDPEAASAQGTTIFSIDLPSSLERKINADKAGTGKSYPAEGNQTTQDLEPDSLQTNPDPTVSFSGNAEFRNSRRATNHQMDAGLRYDTKRTHQSQRFLNNRNRTDFISRDVTRGRVEQNPSFVTAADPAYPTNDWQPRFRSQFHRPPAQTEPTIPPESSVVRTQPHRATWQSGLPPTPRSIR